jgi:hypothetical protein
VVGELYVGDTKPTKFDWSSAIQIDDSRAKLIFEPHKKCLDPSNPEFYPLIPLGDSSIFTKDHIDFDIITRKGEGPDGSEVCVQCCIEIIREQDTGFDVGKSYYFTQAGFAIRIKRASLGPPRLESLMHLKQWVHDPSAP